MTILYETNDNLYINLTNKCPCACTFCIRQTRDHINSSGSLWLEREPSTQEIIDAFSTIDISKYKEVVFCGYGEPTERIDVVTEVARFIKNTYTIPTRINTNGLGNLVNNRDITPELKGLIDTVSISLNTPSKERYYELTRSRFGIESFDAMLDFAKRATQYVPNVILSTVSTTITEEEEKECEEICKNLGVTYKIRPYED